MALIDIWLAVWHVLQVLNVGRGDVEYSAPRLFGSLAGERFTKPFFIPAGRTQVLASHALLHLGITQASLALLSTCAKVRMVEEDWPYANISFHRNLTKLIRLYYAKVVSLRNRSCNCPIRSINSSNGNEPP